MKEYEFKLIDTEGAVTLNSIALANHFNQWMYTAIKPFCKGNTLEIGSGVGNISEYFLNDKANIYLSDIRDGYCEALQMKFHSKPTLQGIMTMNLVDDDFDFKFNKHFSCFDTVFALNVVEHIYDDKLAISNCYKLLKPGGHLIVLVPAYQSLFNNFDIELEHYRRYTRKQLESLFVSNNLKIMKSRYFNAAGIAGWFISGKMQHHKIIPEGQIRLYNSLVPLFKLFDSIILHSFGLSVITVGLK